LVIYENYAEMHGQQNIKFRLILVRACTLANPTDIYRQILETTCRPADQYAISNSRTRQAERLKRPI